MRAYNQQIANGIKPSEAYRNTMTSCTKEAKQQAVAIAKGTTTIDAATKSIKESTLAAKANKIAMSAMSTALNIGAFMLVAAAASKLISVFNELIHSEENLRQSASDLGSELSNNSSDIEGYKKKIEELKAVINDSSSSFDEVSQARVDLMAIQDELIEKFGTEKGVIESITSAINDQTNALDELSRRTYFQKKNEFNEKTGGDKFADWLSFGNTSDDRIQSNMDKMVSTMRYSFYELETTGNEVLDNLIAKSYGLNIVEDMYGDGKHFQIYGTLDEIQDKLYGIQELSQDFDLSTGFENSFTKISNDVDDALTKFKNLYDQYVLYEKILTDNPDNQYDEQFDLINKAKEAYNEAVKSGNEENIKTSADEYAKTLQSAIDLAMGNYDYDVADYFKAMYPELQQMFGEWQFSLNFEPNTDGLQDKVADALDSIDGVSDGTTSFSVEDIENFNPNVATQEQIDAYGELTNVAETYGLTVKQLIALLQTMGLIQSESYQQLVDTFGQDNVDKLSPEDLEIAYKIKNVGNMTFEQLQTEIQKSKELADKNPISSTITSSIEQIARQLEPQFAKLGEAYKAIFEIDEETGKENFSLEDVDNSMLEDLRKSFAEIEEEIGVTFDATTLEPFFDTLTNGSSTTEQVHQAFNDLATAYFYSTETLEQLNEETAESIVKQLEEMGVVNAQEVVYDELNAKTEALALQKRILAETGIDVMNASSDVVSGLLNEAGASEVARNYLFNLIAQEQIFSNSALDTGSKVAQLQELATAYGQTAVAAKIARMEDEYTKSHQPINYEEIAKAAQAEINNAVNTVHVDFKGVSGAKPGSGGSSSSKTEKDTTKEYDWIEQAIENVEKEIKELDETANSSYSTFSQKNEALTKEIGKVTEEIELQQKAYEEYMRKADSIGLPDSYKELVQSGAINIEDIKDEKLQEQIDGYQKWYEKAQNASDAIKELKTDLKDLHVESYKLQTENLKDRLDSDSITEKQYLAGLKSAYEQFYGNLEEYDEQYHEAKLEYLEEEKKYLNSVASAAASLLDTEIDRIREDADEQEEQLKGQVELLKARKKPLQDELDALDEKARKEELALNLQKAQYDLARAENQRSKLIYSEEKGMHYVNDPKEIRDAQKDLDDAKLEIHKQSIQDQIDVLDDEITKYDELIDQINKAADAQVKALEKIKNKWQEVIDQQDYAKNITILTGEFGSDAIVKILTGNDDDLLAQWKNSYINTLKGIDLESQGYIGDLTKQIESLYRNVANTVNTASVQNSSGKAVTLSDGTIITPDGREIKPYNPENDNSSFGELYRAWTKYYGDINNNVEEIRKNLSQHLVIEHGQKMMNNVNQINNSNIRNVTNNNSKNMQPSVHVDKIEITCPGVTSQEVMIEVGNALDKQLGHLSQRAMQEAYKR